MNTPTEILVRGDGPELAVLDYGGTGSTVLLLHGAGGTALDWAGFAPLLTTRHRVLAPDLRGHGHSGDGPWTWPEIVADLDRVITHFGTTDLAVVGMSLGGMAAAQLAQSRSDLAAIVNIDGHGEPSHYPELSAADHAALKAKLTAAFDNQERLLSAPLDDDMVTAVLAHQRDRAANLGLPELATVGSTKRNHTVHNGQTYQRPTAGALADLRATLDIPILPAYQEIRCPALSLVACRLFPAQELFGDYFAAQRRGVLADLAEIAARQPNLRVEEVDASHGMVFERPAQIADRVLDFLGAVPQYSGQPADSTPKTAADQSKTPHHRLR